MVDILLETVFLNEEITERELNKSLDKGIKQHIVNKYKSPVFRNAIYQAMKQGVLLASPPKKAAIPKNDGTGDMRIVKIEKDVLRILLAIINSSFFKVFGREFVHSTCKSYQKGLSCQKAVKEVIRQSFVSNKDVFGGKYDFHHYFDDVSKDKVFELLDRLERKLGFEKGTEPVINFVRTIYDNDLIYDLNGELITEWSGIRQGNPLGSFFADAIMYELDDFMSTKYRYYVRYSDDLIVLGDDLEEITSDIKNIITKYGITLNPKKIEPLKKDTFFKFLGFSINGNKITLSKKRLETIESEIKKRTIGNPNATVKGATKALMEYFYGNPKSDFEYCMASAVLTTMNIDEDIKTLDIYAMDCLRAVMTGKKDVGGLGFENRKDKVGVITRGKGQNVRSNREKTEKIIPGYITLQNARRLMLMGKEVFANYRRNI